MFVLQADSWGPVALAKLNPPIQRSGISCCVMLRELKATHAEATLGNDSFWRLQMRLPDASAIHMKLDDYGLKCKQSECIRMPASLQRCYCVL